MFDNKKISILLAVVFLVGCKSTLTLNEAPASSYSDSARVYLAPLVLGSKGVKMYYPDDLTISYGPSVLPTNKLTQLTTFCQKSYDQDNNVQAHYGDDFFIWLHNQTKKELKRHNLNLVSSPQDADLIICPTFLSLLYYGDELGPSIILRTYGSPNTTGSFSSLVVDVSQKGIYFPLYEGAETITGRRKLLSVIVQQLVEKSVEKRVFNKPENLNDLPKEKYLPGQLVQLRELNLTLPNKLEKRPKYQEEYFEPPLSSQAFTSSAPAFYNTEGLINLSSLSKKKLNLQDDLNDDYFSGEGDTKYRLNIETIRPEYSFLFQHDKETDLFYTRERFDIQLTIEQLYPKHSVVYQSTDQIFSDNYCYSLCRNAHEYKDKLILLRMSEFKGEDINKELSEVYADMNDFAKPPNEAFQVFHSALKGTFSAVKKLEPVASAFWNGAKAIGSGVKTVGSGMLSAATSNEMVRMVSGVSSSAGGGRSSQEIMQTNYQQQRQIVRDKQQKQETLKVATTMPLTLQSKPQPTSVSTEGNVGYHTPNLHNTDISKISCSKLSPIKNTVEVKVFGAAENKSGHYIKLSFLSYDSCDAIEHTPGQILPIDEKVKDKCSGTLKAGQFWGNHAPKESTVRGQFTVGYERIYTCETSNKKQSSSVTR